MSKAQQLVDIFVGIYGDEPRTISKDEVKSVAKEHGINSLYRILNANNEAGNGLYHFPPVGKSVSNSSATRKVVAPKPVAVVAPIAPQPTAQSVSHQRRFHRQPEFPRKTNMFVPFGNFKVVRDIIKSRDVLSRLHHWSVW